MKKIKCTALFLLLAIMWGCTSNESKSGIEEIQKKQNEQQAPTKSSDQYLDSLKEVNSNIETLQMRLETKREQINYVSAKKDSILKASEQIRVSLEQVKSRKIDPGIEGVNLKLDELKGQKENLLEQQNLQKQEVILAEKKIILQKEEKEVYNAQRQALWDKGAPPADFKNVDSLLIEIDKYLNEQNTRLKNLNRSIADIDEQITAIDQQRNSLSSKIRSNYTAQKIFEEYSAEEGAKLEKLQTTVEEELKLLLAEQDDITSALALKAGDKSYLIIKQDKQNLLELNEEARQADFDRELAHNEAVKAKNTKRILNVFIVVFIAVLVLYMLYYIGKKRKSQKK